MFGMFKKVRARKACIHALHMLLIRPGEPWPDSIWADPYALGFMGGTCTIMMELAGVDKLKSRGQIGSRKKQDTSRIGRAAD